ncbi:endonuclease III [Pontixanthobacter aestiaquae]|uniref:Endonuclease III n=1 Tax=Pontixanthobacter aestiaquae TaxID=1509367 RepID=A0A844Z6A2_9SPHN|nr:endonuclease III [Pontixanthobacter aestiaquae]MDN3646643.1 endonuclease III [Pontixanthobacter aestiaquae]MXO82373.1 endonuclease III [Pontixanthobacter aestiaquae]
MNKLLNAEQVEQVFRRLAKAMPGRTSTAKGPKGQPDAFRSCISCMLSAQSLDRNTAKASRALFALANTPEDMLELDDRDIAAAIKPAGLYNNKTRNIRKFCEALIAEHGGVVPDTREGLLSLPGIGRKCADIVLSFTFGKDVIAVDTHVHRVCNRIGLTAAKLADATARQLEERAPEWALRDGHFWLIQFGKRVCTSRAPKCESCPISDLCLYWSAKQES